ncbi:MAG: hypothetical protein R3C58_16235, partial [Parvularculaceae bacterium]
MTQEKQKQSGKAASANASEAPKKSKKGKKKKGKAKDAKPAPEAIDEPPAKPAEAPKAAAAKPHKPAASKALYEDFDALSEYLTEISGKSQDVVRDYFARTQDVRRLTGEIPSDPLNVGEAFQEMLKGLSADPGTVMQRQFNLWGDYARLMATMSRKMAGETVQPAVLPAHGDKRFTHPAWNENPMLDFVKQSYLIFARWLEKTISEIEFADEHEK